MRVSVEKGQNWKVISIPVRARNNVIDLKTFRVIVTPGHIYTHKKVIIALLYSVCRDNINLDCILVTHRTDQDYCSKLYYYYYADHKAGALHFITLQIID